MIFCATQFLSNLILFLPSFRDLFLFDGKEESTLETVIKVESCLLSRRTDDDLFSVALGNVLLFVDDVE